MVLELGEQHLVARPEALSQRAGEQVHRLRDAAQEHDFDGFARVQERADLFARRLEGVRCALRQKMHAAMHIGRIARVVADQRVDHGLGLERGRGAVEVDERLSVHALAQSRKIGAHPLEVEPTTH